MSLRLNFSPTLEEAAKVSDLLREEEAVGYEEIGVSPADSCLKGIRGSRYVATIHDEQDMPIALCGLIDHETEKETAIAWSMTTIAVTKRPLAFVKAMLGMLEDYGGMYDRIISLALEDNIRHQRFHLTMGMLPTDETIKIPDSEVSYKVFEVITVKGLNKIYYEQH